MLNVISNQGDSYETTVKPQHIYKDGYTFIKGRIIDFGEDLEKLEFSSIADGNVKSYNHCRTVFQFLKKINIEIIYDPVIPLIGK